MDENKRYKRMFKKQKGITLISLIVTIIILLILAGVTISTLFGDNGIIKKAQEAKNTWDNAIQSDVEAIENLQNQLYDEMCNTDTIPISTSEQLLKIGTGEEITINGIHYVFDTGKTYLLQNDIEYTGSYDNIAQLIQNNEITFEGQGHQIIVTNDSGEKEYYTENSKYYIATNQYGYVLEGLQLYYDGIDNTGTGTHSNTTTIWKDLSGNNRDGTLQNMDITSCWEEDELKFDGIDDYVLIAEMNYDNITLEAVCTKLTNSRVQIISNVDTGGYGIYQDSNYRFGFEVYIAENQAYSRVLQNTQTTDMFNSRYSVSGSYDGKTMKIRTSSGETNYQELAIEGTIGKPNNSTHIILGANPTGTQTQNEYLNGSISSVRIYNRALTDEENAVNYLNDRERYGV